MNRSPLHSRVWAASLHLTGSALLAALAAALVFLLWYPWPYSVLAGGIGLFMLITGVDVVMGPLITFVIFDRRKPARELRHDLSIVVLLQLAALVYGLHVMYAARPVVLAFEGQRFRVVAAVDVAQDELPQAPPALQTLSVTGPVVVGTESPTDLNRQLEAIERALAGADIGTRPMYWRPWDESARKRALAEAKSLSPLRKRYESRAAEFDAAVASSGKAADQLRYLPMLSRHADWVALLDAQSGEIAGFAPFDGY